MLNCFEVFPFGFFFFFSLCVYTNMCLLCGAGGGVNVEGWEEETLTSSKLRDGIENRKYKRIYNAFLVFHFDVY